jgi:AraC-like DNA-binding protein
MVHREPPHLDQASYPTNLIAALVGVLAEDGVTAAESLHGSDLQPEQLHASDTLISYRQILTVWDNALRLARNPAVALLSGQRMHFAAYGVVGYAVLSSSTHAAGAASAIKYSRLVGPLADIDFEQDGEMAVWLYEPIFWSDPADPRYRAALEFHLASHATVGQNLYGPAFRIAEVRTSCAAPAHVQAYERIFQCPILFGQPRNELRYDARRMNEPMAFSNAVTHATVSDRCEQYLARLRHSGGLGADIQRILMEQPGRFCDMESIAAELSMNARMLRRRLETEGSSFRTILARVREHLALSYLRTTSMTHEEIAMKLGYSDAANFRHAFLRWTGRNPSEFRGKERSAVSVPPAPRR